MGEVELLATTDVSVPIGVRGSYWGATGLRDTSRATLVTYVLLGRKVDCLLELNCLPWNAVVKSSAQLTTLGKLPFSVARLVEDMAATFESEFHRELLVMLSTGVSKTGVFTGAVGFTTVLFTAVNVAGRYTLRIFRPGGIVVTRRLRTFGVFRIILGCNVVVGRGEEVTLLSLLLVLFSFSLRKASISLHALLGVSGDESARMKHCNG